MEQNLVEIVTAKDWVERHSTGAVAVAGVGLEPVRCEFEHSVRRAEGHRGETPRKAGLDWTLRQAATRSRHAAFCKN